MPYDPFPERTPAELPPRYPPMGDYGLIGDCRTAALVSRWGSVDWLCLPHFSGGPVFAALLDRDRGGAFWIRPAGRCSVSRRYIDETNVLQTRFETGAGVVQVTDCMPVCTGPSAYLEPQRELLRRIDCLDGDVHLEVHYAPRFELDRRRRPLRRRGALGWACQHGSEQLFLYGDLDLQPDGDHAVGTRLRLRAGERRWLSLTYVQRDAAVIAPIGDAAEQRLQATVEWWRNWSARCRYDGPYREEVHRSLLALKLLTFHLSGAVIAAPTASLPEWIGGVRNWDYRYCWLRDAALIFEAFAGVGHVAEAHAFLGWLLHATRLTWPELQVMYDVYGETRLTEQELDLEGYRGSRPVRVGNAAHSQVQLDTYGAVISAAAAFLDGGGRLDAKEAEMLVGLGRRVCRHWRQPDKGIWEVRGEGRHNVHSKLMCWVGLDCLVRLHERGLLPAKLPRADFVRERDAIAEAIETRGFDEEIGAYTGAFGEPDPDASLLLMTRYGFKQARDSRMAATWRWLRHELEVNGMFYRHKGGLDGLPPSEGAFVICSFWAVDQEVAAGDLDAAQRRFEHLLSLTNDLGLLAEEADPSDGSSLGNFPQGFSHVGLIGAALSLQDLETAQRRGSREDA